MLIDCDSCAVRRVHCDDCVISVLLATPPTVPSRRGDRLERPELLEFDGDEQVALVRLAAAGLVPPLRLVADAPPGAGSGAGSGRSGDTRGIA